MGYRRWLIVFLGCATVGCADPAHQETSNTVAATASYEPQVGDLVFQSLPHGPLIDAIEGATKSPISHVGLVVKNDDKWAVLEAIGPVTETPLEAYLGRGREGSFAVFRLDDKYADKISAIVAEAEKYKGKPYDVHYDFDDVNIYCSELIFKAFQTVTGEELGVVRKLGDLDWKPHETLIRFIEQGNLPLDRKMITPVDMAAAKQLHPVMRKGL